MKKIAKKKFNIKDLKIDKQLFNSVYLPHLFDYSHRYNLYYGGRNSGKSYFIVDKLILLGISEKRRMLFLIKQTNRVNETIWRLALDSLEKFQLYEYCEFNKSEHTIIFPNGTYIKMSGMDSENKARGFVDIDTVFFEECTDFLEEDIESVDGTLRGKVKNKSLYFAMNPISMQSWTYKRWFTEGANLDDTFILKSTYLNNKWVDDATIKRMERLKERNPARYKIEAEGNFATLDLLVFSYTPKKFDVNELIRNNTELITCIGMDFGFNDPTTCILSLYDEKTKTLYICDEIYRKGLTNEDIARLVKEKGWHKNVIVADSANPKDIADLRKMGLTKIKPCKKGANSIISGIRKMQEMDIVINEDNCENTITEFDNYAWKKDKNTGEYIDVPIDTFNHCIDGIRYSIMMNIRKKPKFLTVKL